MSEFNSIDMHLSMLGWIGLSWWKWDIHGQNSYELNEKIRDLIEWGDAWSLFICLLHLLCGSGGHGHNNHWLFSRTHTKPNRRNLNTFHSEMNERVNEWMAEWRVGNLLPIASQLARTRTSIRWRAHCIVKCDDGFVCGHSDTLAVCYWHSGEPSTNAVKIHFSELTVTVIQRKSRIFFLLLILCSAFSYSLSSSSASWGVRQPNRMADFIDRQTNNLSQTDSNSLFRARVSIYFYIATNDFISWMEWRKRMRERLRMKEKSNLW